MLVRLDGEPGTSNPTDDARSPPTVSRELRSVPGVDNVGAHVGRAVTGDQIVDVNSSEVWVSIASDADYDDTVAAIEDAVGRVPGVEREVVDLLDAEDRATSGRSNQGEQRRQGQRPRRPDRVGQAARRAGLRPGPRTSSAPRPSKVRQLMSGVDGVVDPRVELPPEQPSLEIEVDLAKAQALRHQARRRAPRGGHAAAGHPGRQRVRGAEGLRRDRPGRARDAPERDGRAQPADRPARRRPRALGRGRRRAWSSRPDRDRA